MRGRTVAALVVAALGVAAPARAGDIPTPNPEVALPGLVTGPGPQPHGVPHCRRARLACIDGLIRRLRRQWHRLDATCDHRAVFSLAYLRITQGLRRAIVVGELRDPAWMEDVITAFSNRYLATFADAAAGRPVPESWQLAYDEDRAGDANAGQDTLLASNAHTQHDLPYIYVAMGLTTRNGASRKHDHDVVNAINDAVFSGLERYYAAHYDPFMGEVMLAPAGSDRIGTLSVIQLWREGAWRNAERLAAATTDAQRELVEQEIDDNANAWADLIRSGDQPGYRATRDAFCHTHR
jgi:Family of unknown function (DUF5995)